MAFTDTFGTIKPPAGLENFTKGDLTGAAGISKFFNNFIGLIYSAAAVVFILMILWGAWDWITSEGEKDKIQAAQRKIINAIVGILLFAAAFAIISVVGQFTGFKFFNNEPRSPRPEPPNCSAGFQRNPVTDDCERIPTPAGLCNTGFQPNPQSGACEPI